MRARARRRQLLLSTATLIGALSGYGRSAYAACVVTTSPNVVCSGAETDEQALLLNNVVVTTTPGFSVNTGDNAGVTIIGDGALTYTDANNSALTGADYGLVVIGTGDDGSTPGSIAVNTGGALSGSSFGLRARNYGTGATTLTATGNITSTGGLGIYANTVGTDLNITTGAGVVQGALHGIDAINTGSGATTIITNGNVTGTLFNGIRAANSGTDLSVTTAASTTVTAGAAGIHATNTGSGILNIMANGSVTGDAGDGIYAVNDGTSLSVTTGVGTTVTGADRGIRATNNGSGAVTVTANGNVSTTNAPGFLEVIGIEAVNSVAGTDVTVNTGVGTTVTGGSDGIRATNNGDGALNITANGNVTGTTREGIFALNQNGTESNITTGAGTTVMGDANGIAASHYGSDALTIRANGNVTGTNGFGIFAFNSDSSGDLNVITGAGTTVTGANNGIYANNLGEVLNVTVNGNVTGGGNDAIYAQNSTDATDLNVTTGVNTTVTGDYRGINARNLGSGALTIIANGDVTGTNGNGIYAYNLYNNLNVTTGPGTTITGNNNAIDARNSGLALNMTINGDVTSYGTYGIYARNEYGSTDLDVTTAANTTVMSNYRGLQAANYGSGAMTVTANGDVTGTNSHAIFASNSGTSLRIVTAAGTTLTTNGYGVRARNFGTGALTVVANGDIDPNASIGLFATSSGGGSISVTTGASSNTGGGIGIYAHASAPGTLEVSVGGNITSSIQGIVALSNGGEFDVTTNAGSNLTSDGQGIFAQHFGSEDMNITINGTATAANDDGIYARHFGSGTINITVGASGNLTSNGVGADNFAIQTFDREANITVAGTVNGAAGGAIAFDLVNSVDDRLTFHPGGTVNGDVFAGPGSDTLAFGGTGDGAFDLTDIDTGGNTEQFRDFETFEVNSGSWNLSNTTTAAFAVNGGTLKGNGTFGDLTVNGGTLSPGNSFGTTTVNGVFTLNAGATYEVEVDAAGQTDKVVVNGTVNLTGATLSVLAQSGDYALETDYIIIDNDGTDAVNGTFGTITSSLAFLVPFVSYVGGTGNDVVLTLERREIDLCDVTNTQNQCDVAMAIEQFPMDNPLFLAVLGQTAAGARQAFDALSGEIHATAAGVLVDDNRYVREAIMGRLMQAGHTNGKGQVTALGAAGPQVASLDQSAMALGYDNVASPSSPMAFWTAAYGAWGTYDGNGNAATADRDLGGFMSGMDAGIGGSWRVGLTTGASYSNIDVDERHSSANVESYYLGGYMGGMVGAFALRGGGTWAWSEIDTSRAVIFPGFYERQKANYDADTSQLFGELAYPTTMGGMSVEPFGGLAYVSVDTDTFLEHGGAQASLRGRDSDQTVGYTTLGLRVATTSQWGSMLVTPHLSARWLHAFDDVTPSAALAFASTGAGFNVSGVPLAEDSALIDAGLDFALGENTSAGVSYSGQFGEGVQDNAVKGRFTWLF